MTLSPTRALGNVVGAITREILKGTFSFETDIEHTFGDKPVHIRVSNGMTPAEAERAKTEALQRTKSVRAQRNTNNTRKSA